MRVKLTGGGSRDGGIITGPGTSAKAGEVVELPTWTALHLIQNDLAVEIKGGK